MRYFIPSQSQVRDFLVHQWSNCPNGWYTAAPRTRQSISMSRHSQLRILRDVKKGEETFISYCDISDTTAAHPEKLAPYGFECQCPRCTDANSDNACQEFLKSVPVSFKWSLVLWRLRECYKQVSSSWPSLKLKGYRSCWRMATTWTWLREPLWLPWRPRMWATAQRFEWYFPIERLIVIEICLVSKIIRHQHHIYSGGSVILCTMEICRIC